MSYSDYNRRVSDTNQPLPTNITEIQRKTTDSFPKVSDKTAEISQPIFENSQSTRSTNSVITEHEVAHPITDADQHLPPTPAKADNVSTPILISSNGENHNISENLKQHDLSRMHAVNDGISTPSKFDKMDENQLLKALNKPLSPADLAKISARFEELDEHVAALEDKAQTPEDIDKVSARLSVLNEVAEKLEEHMAKQAPQQKHLADTKKDDIAKIAPIASIDTQKIENLKNFRVLTGTTLKEVRSLEEANGVNIVKINGTRLDVTHAGQSNVRPGTYYDEVEGRHIDIQEIHTMSEEEVQRFRDAYAAHYAILNQSINQEEPQNKRDTRQQSQQIPIKELTDIKDAKKQENTQAKQRDILPSDISSNTGKDIRAANQKRIEEFIQYMDKKLERIKAEVNKHELSQGNIKRDELNTSDTKINGEYQQLRKLYNEGRIDIPLSTLNKFFKLDQTVQQLTRMVPKHDADSNTYEAIAEAKVMRKEIMTFMHETVSKSGNIPRHRGESGDKSPAPAA